MLNIGVNNVNDAGKQEVSCLSIVGISWVLALMSSALPAAEKGRDTLLADVRLKVESERKKNAHAEFSVAEYRQPLGGSEPLRISRSRMYVRQGDMYYDSVVLNTNSRQRQVVTWACDGNVRVHNRAGIVDIFEGELELDAQFHPWEPILEALGFAGDVASFLTADEDGEVRVLASLSNDLPTGANLCIVRRSEPLLQADAIREYVLALDIDSDYRLTWCEVGIRQQQGFVQEVNVSFAYGQGSSGRLACDAHFEYATDADKLLDRVTAICIRETLPSTGLSLALLPVDNISSDGVVREYYSGKLVSERLLYPQGIEKRLRTPLERWLQVNCIGAALFVLAMGIRKLVCLYKIRKTERVA